jgi:hypothetical protein
MCRDEIFIFLNTEFQNTVSLPITRNMSHFYHIYINNHMLQGIVDIFRFLVPLCCVSRQWLMPFYMASRCLDTFAAPLIQLSTTRVSAINCTDESYLWSLQYSSGVQPAGLVQITYTRIL